jgi:hypothetical protein
MKGLLLALLLVPQDAWWDPGWAFRRRIEIRNNLDDAPLRAGHPVSIEFDADYLGIRGKSRGDLADLAVVHVGNRLPHLLLPGRSEARRVLWFRTAEDLRAGAKDARYALYYGNPAADAKPADPGAVFEFHETFDSPEALRRLEVDRDVKAAVRDGALRIEGGLQGRSPEVPARLSLRLPPPEGGFELSVEITIQAPPGAVLGVDAAVDLKEPRSDDPALAKRIDALIELLGDADWDAREKATGELVKIGRAAVAKLLVATRASDAEVKWRAEHLLKEIRENAPSPTVSAGLLFGDPKVGPVAFSSRIGKPRYLQRAAPRSPLRTTVTIARDADGEVTLLWDGGRPQTGRLEGPVESLSLALWQASAGPGVAVSIDALTVRRRVDDDSRPTHVLEVEEARP